MHKYLHVLVAFSITMVHSSSDRFLLKLLRMDHRNFELKEEDLPMTRNIDPNFFSDLARLNLKETIMDEVWKLLLSDSYPSEMSRSDWKAYENILGTLPTFVILGLNISDPDIIEYFGSIQDLKFRQLAAFGDLLKNKFGGYLFHDNKRLLQIGNLLCGFNTRELEKIPPRTFHSLLDKKLFNSLKGCSKAQCKSLLNVASKYTALGPPASWSAKTITALGNLLAGLDSKLMGQIRDESCRGITPDIIDTISVEVLSSMRLNQILFLEKRAKLAWRRKTKNTSYIGSATQMLAHMNVTITICLAGLIYSNK